MFFLTAFDKANGSESSCFTNQPEKITTGFCLKVSSNFTVHKLSFVLRGILGFWDFLGSVGCSRVSLFRKNAVIGGEQ